LALKHFESLQQVFLAIHNDIVQELPEGVLNDILPKKNTHSIKEMDKTGSKVLKCLSYEPMSVDQLVEKTKLSP